MKEIIAIINDDQAFLEFMRDFISHETDYDVVTGKKGENAISTLLRVKPDLVVLDIILGEGQHGHNVLQVMREHEDLRDVPVIICTTDDAFLKQNAVELASLNSDWISKPFDLDDLIAKIRFYLPPRKAAV